MLDESAARAEEVLCLNVEDLYPQDKRGEITAKGGATKWIHWRSGTAQRLPRLIARRTCGPLFLTDRRASAGTATLDVCEETVRAQLSSARGQGVGRLSVVVVATFGLGGAVLLEVLEHGGSQRRLPGERGDERVLGGHRLQVADPALQPAAGGSGEDQQRGGRPGAR
nr:hypothetical protein [Streptomyces marokkonensis]